MRKVKLNSKNESLKLGLIANWKFARDKVISPEGQDIMLVDTPEWRANKPINHNNMQGWYDSQPCELSKLVDGGVMVYFGTKKEVYQQLTLNNK